MRIVEHSDYLSFVAVRADGDESTLHLLRNKRVGVQALLYQLGKDEIELSVQQLLYLHAQLIQHNQCVLAEG